MLYNLCFINLSKVHPWPFNREYLITGRNVSWTVWIICPAFSSTALLRLGRWVGLSSHSYPYVSITVVICPLWDSLFLQDAFPTPWPFDKSWGFQSILGGPPFNCLFMAFSGGGSKVFRSFDLDFRASWCVPLSNILVVIHSCFWFDDRLNSRLVAFWRDLAYPLITCDDRGFGVLGKTASRLQAMSWEASSLTSMFFVTWQGRAWWAILPFSLPVFCFRALFPHSTRRI